MCGNRSAYVLVPIRRGALWRRSGPFIGQIWSQLQALETELHNARVVKMGALKEACLRLDVRLLTPPFAVL